MPLPEVGLAATIDGLPAFEAGAKSIGSSIDVIDKKANLAGGSVGIMSTGLLGLGQIAATTATAGILAAAGAIGGVVAVGLDFNNSMEQASARIQAFTKDSDETTRILEMLRVEAAKTPFTFEDMSAAAASLLPATAASGESLEELIETAEILAASNPLEGLEGASFSLKEAITGDFTSVIERFNLSRDSINRMKAEGVPNIEILQRAMEEMGLDIDLVTALANTAEGRWSTFTDTFTNLAGIVTQPIFDLFSNSLGVVNDFLADNELLLTDMAERLAHDVANGIDMVIGLFEAFQEGGLTGLITAIGLDEETTKMILDSLDFINQHIEELTGALIAIGATAAVGVVIMGLVAIIGALASPIVLVVAASALLGAAWAGDWGGIQEKTMAVWAVVEPILSDIWKWLSVNIPAAVQASADFWNNILYPALLFVGNYIVTFISFWASVGNVLNAIVNKAIEASAGLWQNILLPAMTKVGDYLAVTFGPAFEAIGDFFSRTFGPILNKVGLEQLPSLETVLGKISGIVQPLTGFFNDWAGAINAFKLPEELTPGSLSPFEAVLEGMANTLTGPLDGALTKFAEESQPAIRTLHQLLLSTLAPTLQGIADNVVFIFTTWADSIPPLVEAMFPLNTVAENTGASLDVMAASLDTIAASLFSVSSSTAGAIAQLDSLNNLDLDDITEEAEFLEDAVDDVEGAFGDAKTAAVKLENVEFNSLIGWLEDVNTEIQKAIRGFNDMVQAAEDASQAPGVGGATMGVFSPDLFMALAGGSASTVSGPTPAVINNTTNIFMTNDFGGNTISSGMDEAAFDHQVLNSIQRLMG